MPVPPLPGPPSINVVIKPNTECITPLQLGNITYEYPLTSSGSYLTTSLVSEIVVTKSPVSYSRFAALFGAEPTISMQRTNAADSPAQYSTELKLSSFIKDPDNNLFEPADQLVYNTNTVPENAFVGSVFNPARFERAVAPVASGYNTPTLSDINSPQWANRNASSYYPLLDFFPRYNQWFASTFWATPYDPGSLPTPDSYSLMLVYVDRQNKTVYYRNATATFAVEPVFDALNGRLQLDTSRAYRASAGFFSDYVFALSGNANLKHPTLVSVPWTIDLILDGVVRKSINTNKFTLPTKFQLPWDSFGVSYQPGAVPPAGTVFEVVLRATSMDPAAVQITSNTIYVLHE